MSSTADASTPAAWNAALRSSADRIIREAADPHDQTEQALEDALAKIEGLEEALRTRTIIGQATGWLMRDARITADAAFDQLVRLSSDQEVKVRTIAAQLVIEADQMARENLSGGLDT